MGDQSQLRARRAPRPPALLDREFLGPPRRRDVRSLVVPLVLAAVLGVAVAVVPAWAALGLVAVVAGALVLRPAAAVGALVLLAPLVSFLTDQGDVSPGGTAALVGSTADLGTDLGLVAVVVLLGAWTLARARGWWAVRATSRAAARTAVVLVVVLVALAVGGWTGGLGPSLRQLAPAVVALVLLDLLGAQVDRRRLAGVHVGSAALCASAVVAAVVAGRTLDLTVVALHLVSAAPLLVALAGRRHLALSAAGLVLLVSSTVLGIVAGAVSPALLLGLLAALVVAGVTGQLGVRALIGVVAVALVAVGLVPQVAERLDLSGRLAAATNGWPTVGGLEVVVVLALAVTAAAGGLASWRREQDALAGAVGAAAVGLGLAVVLSGVGLEALPLWLLVALATAPRRCQAVIEAVARR